MNDYMQQNSDLGSIFVVQYAKEIDKDAKSKTPGRGKGGKVNDSDDSLEDDPLVSIDDDDKKFTLNECAHLCALLNDLHLQFNDMRHGKYSTMAMIHLLMKNRKKDSSKESNADQKAAAAAASQSSGVKGSIMAAAGIFIFCITLRHAG